MSHFRWASPEALTLLALLPLGLLLGWLVLRWQSQRLQRSLSPRLLPFLTASVHGPRRRLKRGLEALALALLILALARPQLGDQQQEIRSEGIEVMLLLDLSRSMLAEDVRPSRLELAKRELSRFLDMSSGDRMGLVAFAGSAITLAPLTSDFGALKMYIEPLGPESVTTQGTNFFAALSEAYEAFQRSQERDQAQSVVTRVVVMVSDGEDHEAEALNLARQMASEGIRLFTLGVGTEKGGPIPLRDRRGQLRGHHRDSQGQVVVSTARPEALQALAREGQGAYYHLTFGGDAMSRLRADLKSLEQTQFASAQALDWEERYQIILVFALLLAAVELALGERKTGSRRWRGRFEVGES